MALRLTCWRSPNPLPNAAVRTSTIILLRSLAGRSGVFDAPVAHHKPSPDLLGGAGQKGSSDQVRAETTSTAKAAPPPPSPDQAKMVLPSSNGKQANRKPLIRTVPSLMTPPAEGDDGGSVMWQVPSSPVSALANGPVPTPALAIPVHMKGHRASSLGLVTPPLTPEDDKVAASARTSSIPTSSSLPRSDAASINSQQTEDLVVADEAFAFLSKLFMHSVDARRFLPYACHVKINVRGYRPLEVEGAVLDIPRSESRSHGRALYVNATSPDSLVTLKESIVALLDLASEIYEASALILVLPHKRTSNSPIRAGRQLEYATRIANEGDRLGPLLHSLLYVGGSLIARPVAPINSGLVLVGMEL